MEDVNKICSSHDNFREILDLRDNFNKWKSGLEENNSIEAPDSFIFDRRVEEGIIINFKKHFNESLKGRLLYGKFTQTNVLDELQKKFVIREATECLLKAIPDFPSSFPSLREVKMIAKQVMSLFPEMFTFLQLTGVELDNNGKETNVARGKIRQRVYDVAKELKKKRTGESVSSTTDMDEDPLSIDEHTEVNNESNDDLNINAELEQCFNFVKSNKGPEARIMTDWMKSYSIRKNYKFDDIPALRQSFGYKMLLYDFEEMYPNKIDGFKFEFEYLKKKMKYQFDREITDKIGKERILALESTNDTKIQNFLYLAILPFLFPPKATKLTNMKRFSVAKAADFFICHVKVSKYVLLF